MAPQPINIDIVSDTVCPWCFIGKRRLERAMKQVPENAYQISWHPFLLNPLAPAEGVNKRQMYAEKFGQARVQSMIPMMERTFAQEGEQYCMDGLTGSTLNSHRLIALAGKQGAAKQDKVVEALMKAYFTEGKFINDRQVLLEAAKSAGVTGAEEFLADEDAGKEEVIQELQQWAKGISGVPHFIISSPKTDGKAVHLSGAQDPATFVDLFQRL